MANLFVLSTCRWACVTFVVVTDCQSCTTPTSTNPHQWRLRAECSGVFRRTPSRGGHGRRAAVHFVVCVGCSGIACFYLPVFLLANAHGLLQVCGRLTSGTSPLESAPLHYFCCLLCEYSRAVSIIQYCFAFSSSWAV